MTGPFPQIPDISRGLPPVTGPEPLVLILGSFPSVLSLAHSEYYGNPRNRFWAVMEELFAIPAALPYPERTLRLTQERDRTLGRGRGLLAGREAPTAGSGILCPTILRALSGHTRLSGSSP